MNENDLPEIDLALELLNFNSSDDQTDKKQEQRPQCTRCADTVNSVCLKRETVHLYRRAFSESKLFDIIDRDFTPGATYHCISGGDIDSLSYVKHIIRQQDLNYLLLSTWCMANDDVLQLREWVEAGKIKRLDAYCGEIFPGSYSVQHEGLKKVVDLCSGRVAIFRNHAKVYAGTGDKFSFGIESSANINTNPRTENTTITVSQDIFEFYKDFFDKIRSFNRDYDNWKIWNKSS